MTSDALVDTPAGPVARGETPAAPAAAADAPAAPAAGADAPAAPAAGADASAAPAAAAGASDERRLACAALTRAVPLDGRDFHAVHPALPPEEIWARLVAGDTDVLPEGLVAATRHAVAAADPHRDLAAIAAAGGRLVCPGDAEWPELLDDLGPRRPVALWARGRGSLRDLTTRAVAVVGSRAATPYGNQVATELAVELGDRGWATVSGGAYGIDAAAHRGSLAAGAGTVAVLASGVDVAYPSGNRRLFDEIAASGLLVSEWPPGAAPQRLRFLWRNRVIAALGRGTVAVEMGLRSGARRTCTEAARLGRHVMVVPGPITSAVSVGCHNMLRSREAECVTSAAHVLELVSRLGEDLPEEPDVARTVRDRMSAVAQRVLDALHPREFLTLDDIAVASHEEPAALDVLLDALCEHDLVVCRGGRYRLGPAALPSARRPA